LLEGVDGPVAGLRWESATALRVGRNTSLDIVIEHPSISRNHAEIVYSVRGWIIRDLGSANGTFVNGVRISQDRPLLLQDVVQVGKLALRVTAMEDEVAAPPLPAAKHLKTSGEYVVRVQATAQRSWETALESLNAEKDETVRQGKHFINLLRAGYHFSNVASIEAMLQSVLDDTVALLNAQRGSIVLQNESGELQARAISAARASLLGPKVFSRTLAKRSFQQSESLLCRDVKTELDLVSATSVKQGAMASIICALLRSPRKKLGVLHLDRGPLQVPFTQEEFYLADAIAASISVAIETALLIENHQQTFLQTLSKIALGIEQRTPHLAEHSRRVAEYSLALASELQLTRAETEQVRLGALLHDIGKYAIEDTILRKPEPLTDQEYGHVKSHAVQGANLLAPIIALAPIVPIVRHHHERWDASGYPDGLAGEAIPALARLVTVANTFDVMTSPRPYRERRSVEQAFQEISEKSGSQFDPHFAAAFVHIRPRIEELCTRFHAPRSEGPQ
jgi:putative nucleotidyltransferase with HDIG domain